MKTTVYNPTDDFFGGDYGLGVGGGGGGFSKKQRASVSDVYHYKGTPHLLFD